MPENGIKLHSGRGKDETMGIELILKIAGIGILVAVACQLLKQTGRDDIAMITALAGIVIALMMVVNQIGSLLSSVSSIFGLY